VTGVTTAHHEDTKHTKNTKYVFSLKRKKRFVIFEIFVPS